MTIRIAQPWGEEIFDSRFELINENLGPDITVEYVPFDGSRDDLEALFADNVPVDILSAAI